MDPAAVAKLKAFNLAAITTGLERVAAAWARLCVEGLPLRGTTLEALQREYHELFDALPICTAQEIEGVLQAYARALGLKNEHGTATQHRFVAEHMRSWLRPSRVRWSRRDAAADWLADLCRAPTSRVQCYSTACILYVLSHYQLGATWPTFTPAFQQFLAAPAAHADLVNAEGALLLAPMIRAHSRWIARLIEAQKSVSEEPIAWSTDVMSDDAAAEARWVLVARE
jgi:hypothetical protein